MIRFIKYFIHEWRKYPYHKAFAEKLKQKHPEEFKKMEQSDLERGIKSYKNRLDFAFRNAKMKLSHCVCYGKECRKFGGNCDICYSEKFKRKEGESLDNIKHINK